MKVRLRKSYKLCEHNVHIIITHKKKLHMIASHFTYKKWKQNIHKCRNYPSSEEVSEFTSKGSEFKSAPCKQNDKYKTYGKKKQ